MTAWYQYPQINNFGAYPDPEGAFPKPDVNILAPSGTPFTAPLAGTISGIDTTSSFGDVVTVNLDQPINDSATHYAFLHLSSITPGDFLGEHVNAGDLLGYGGGNQSPSGAMPGFALTASDQYGFGSGWANNVQGTWINPQLDPTSLLNSLAGGNTIPSNISTGSGTSSCDASNPIYGGLCQYLNPTHLTQGGFILFGAIVALLAIYLVFKGQS